MPYTRPQKKGRFAYKLTLKMDRKGTRRQEIYTLTKPMVGSLIKRIEAGDPDFKALRNTVPLLKAQMEKDGWETLELIINKRS